MAQWGRMLSDSLQKGHISEAEANYIIDYFGWDR